MEIQPKLLKISSKIYRSSSGYNDDQYRVLDCVFLWYGYGKCVKPIYLLTAYQIVLFQSRVFECFYKSNNVTAPKFNIIKEVVLCICSKVCSTSAFNNKNCVDLWNQRFRSVQYGLSNWELSSRTAEKTIVTKWREILQWEYVVLLIRF